MSFLRSNLPDMSLHQTVNSGASQYAETVLFLTALCPTYKNAFQRGRDDMPAILNASEILGQVMGVDRLSVSPPMTCAMYVGHGCKAIRIPRFSLYGQDCPHS